MNSDRELLELAAKAAGIEVAWHSSNQPVRLEAGGPFGKVAAGFWNPLIDDGDALRLAVKLNLKVVHHPALNQAIVRLYHVSDDEWTENCEDHPDACAATRRAIVRAAAEIGKAQS